MKVSKSKGVGGMDSIGEREEGHSTLPVFRNFLFSVRTTLGVAWPLLELFILVLRSGSRLNSCVWAWLKYWNTT